MSKESRQRLRDQAKEQDKRLMRKDRLRWFLPLISVIFLAAGFAAWRQLGTTPQGSSCLLARTPRPFKQPRTLKELLALSPEQLEHCDVGLINLLCAEGLPGAEQLDVQASLRILDGMAETVRLETQRHAYRFNEHPDQFRQSLGYYRMMMLGTVLAQDVGIRYNPSLALPQLDGKIPTLGEGANSQDVFIHGLMGTNRMGTCASMPVLVATVARRLGYPVKLAGAKYHLYVRYEEPNGRHFNVEPTVTEAFLTPDDEEYKSGQFKATAEEIKGYTWLQPLSNKQVLAHFLNTRAICLGDAKRYDEAKQTFLQSASFWLETSQRKKSTDYYLQALKDAPTGDRWETLWEEVGKLQVPEGPRSAYFDNRKAQVHYFMNDNSDWPAIEKAAKDLKDELAEYRRQISTDDPALTQYRQHILALNLKWGQVRLPAEVLPPPLNRNSIPPDYLDCVAQAEPGDLTPSSPRFGDTTSRRPPVGWGRQRCCRVGEASRNPAFCLGTRPLRSSVSGTTVGQFCPDFPALIFLLFQFDNYARNPVKKRTVEDIMKMLRIIFFAAAALICSTQVYAVVYLARPYEPNMARWLTRDPIGERGGLNLYGFVRNDPIDTFDAFGLTAHLAPANDIIVNASSYEVNISGDWVEIALYTPGQGTAYAYPWSYSQEADVLLHVPPGTTASISDPSGAHILNGDTIRRAIGQRG